MERWTKADNYWGADWSDHYVVLTQHRDSPIVDQSNFQVALTMLGGESDTVVVARSNQRAVGWVDLLLIHDSDMASIILAYQLQDDILDEHDLAEREWNAAVELWEDTFSLSDRIDYLNREGESIFAARATFWELSDRAERTRDRVTVAALA